MAAQAIGSLYAMLGLDTAAFDAGIANARKKLGEFGKVNFSGALKAGFGELDDMLKGAAGQAGALGNVLAGLGITGAAAGAAIAVAFSGARDAMAFGDEIADTANKLRVTTDYLQEMRFVAHQLGGDFKDADDALADFGKTLGLARSGLSAKAVKPFTALGLDPKDLTTVEAGLKAVTAKIAGLSNAAEQAAIADKLGLTPLLPAIREGTAAMDDMREAARKIGYVMDAELIEKAGAANDEYEALTKVLDVQFKSAMVEAIPLVMKLTEMMVGGAKAAGWFAERLNDAAKIGAMIGKLDPFAQADIQEAKKYDAERKRRMAAAQADFMQPNARATASSLSAWLGTGKEDPATQLKNLNEEQAKASAASRASAKAERDAAAAARERAAALKAIADAMREAEDRSADYAASLLEEITTMGMSSDQLKIREMQMQAAAAPTEALAKHIEALIERYKAQKKVETEAVAVQKAVADQQNATVKTVQDAIGAGIDWSTTLTDLADRLGKAADQSRGLSYDIQDIADAIQNNDWTSAFTSLANVLVNVQKAFSDGATAADKFSAAAGVAQGIGKAIGGTTGNVISGAASGAQAGFTMSGGNPIGAAIGAFVGWTSALFGSSKAKKQQRAQEAAQRAAEEAARQQQISDTTFSLNVALLEAQGKAEEALAMTRQRELDALAKLDPALVALQQQLYAAEDAASAAAKEAEAQAQALQKEIAVRQTQRGIMLQLMALDDAVTGGNSAVLAARQDELAALDPVSRQLKEIYYARLDEGEALAKQAAAVEAATKAQEEAAQAAEAFQQANIGLMRQLMAMDDAVLGTTSARDAARADELAKLDETGKYLQTILWAREDEAAVIAKQAEAISAARDNLARSYEREKSAIEATRDKFEGLAKTLRDFAGSISDDLTATLDPMSRRDAASRAFFDAANRASLGDFDAASLLPKLGEAFKTASEAAASDQLAYLRDLTSIKRATDRAADTAERQVSAADRQLEVLNQQVAGLISIDESVDSVAAAIEKLIAAQGGNKDVAGAAAAAAGLTAAQLSANGNAAFAYGLANSMVGKALAGSTDAAYTAIANAAKGFTPSAGAYFAEGGVFTNGIVSQPTNFSIGQMGEAGPEAIVPLVRGPEGLGVRMSGGNDNSAVIARLEARLASMEAALIAIATSNNSMDRREKRAEVEGYYVRGATPEDPVVTEAA